MTPQDAYEEDVRRYPIYDDGTARPLWNSLDDLVASSWIKYPKPRSFHFTTERVREASRQYEQGKIHGARGDDPVSDATPAYMRGWRFGRLANGECDHD